MKRLLGILITLALGSVSQAAEPLGSWPPAASQSPAGMPLSTAPYGIAPPVTPPIATTPIPIAPGPIAPGPIATGPLAPVHQAPAPQATGPYATGPYAMPQPGLARPIGNVWHQSRQLPAVMPATFNESSYSGSDDCNDCCPCFDVGYDKGIYIDVCDDKCRSFKLNVNGRIQFRYAGFSRDVTSYTDNAGVTIPVRNRGRFDIERARLILSGHALNEDWTYFLQLDGDTDRGSQVVFFDYWWAYRFTESLKVRAGKAKVPGTRQWILSAFKTRLVDRPLSTDFFRPTRTQGVWADGKFGDSVHYEVMLGNGFRTAELDPQEVNNKFAVASSIYWDPWGDYGPQIVDFDCLDSPVARLGTSFVYSKQSGLDNAGDPTRESAFARLSDGTILTNTGALAPGVTVNEYDITLISLDAAAKYRGWSFDAEYYLRWLEDLRADGALPLNELFQYGFYVEGGCFIVPKTFDFNVRYSQVRGEFGDSNEYAFGFGYYPQQSVNVKMTLDATWLDGAPTSVRGSDIIVGDDGMLIRAQLQAFF